MSPRPIVHIISADCTYDLGGLYIQSRRLVHTISAACTYDLGGLRMRSDRRARPLLDDAAEQPRAVRLVRRVGDVGAA